MIEKIIFTDSFETGVYDVACAHLNKEQVAELFNDSLGIPMNDALEADDTYTKGEIQFNFSKETKDLEEVLVFPIYEYDDSEINGDFIPAPDYIITKFADEAREFVYGKPAKPDYRAIAQNAIAAFIDGCELTKEEKLDALGISEEEFCDVMGFSLDEEECVFR